ncbi:MULTISPECIES: hypothetical protein [unclassified Bradyrhizobium]|uniref:hypothetical protein n=1 Tax=unclassified Bradyrhizobium TaxID=2631580 RepID=UPI0028E97118|nr:MULTISPECIES: hypothetical protein [unclassified Bradyrhizobium]
MIQLVPICTIRTKFDATCQVAPGEHDFADAKSYAAYYHICQFKSSVLEEQIQKKIIRTNAPVSAELLKRICDGVLASRHTPPIEKKYYQEQLDAAAKL